MDRNVALKSKLPSNHYSENILSNHYSKNILSEILGIIPKETTWKIENVVKEFAKLTWKYQIELHV